MTKKIEEKAKRMFKDHVAKKTEFPGIVIVDFKKPESIEYSVRFLFDEKQCILHITGDFGYLTAKNCDNMRYEAFGQFVNDPGYFAGKIKCMDCMGEGLYVYDVEKARGDLKNLFWKQKETSGFDVEELALKLYMVGYDDVPSWNEIIDQIMNEFDELDGLSWNMASVVSNYVPDCAPNFETIGRVRNPIIDLLLQAFKMAKAQLDEAEAIKKAELDKVREQCCNE